MTTWNLSNVHSQTGVLTKNSSGNWSYTPTDSDNPVNEYITQSNGTVTWYQVHDGQNYPRYTWPDTISSGDIVAADGTTAANFTHNWGHTSLGTGVLTILINSSGPTVTSHYYVELTENAKVLTSDTVQSSDFTFLKGTTSHTPTNLNLVALSDGTGYVYDYMDNATTDLYTATIDSQPVSHFYYDSSWTLSPQSYTGRTTNSTRILLTLGTIPSLTSMTYSTTVWNSDAPTRASDNRYLSVRFQKSPSTNKPANELYVYFFVFGNQNDIKAKFAGYTFEATTNGKALLDIYVSSEFTIGAQEWISHTFTVDDHDQTVEVKDWIYSDEIEGDNYIAPVKNGGGKPDRYPLIMTNLFNRNRSLYSIGMTHKDTWDLFL